ncbi:hypothetical protein R5R35_002663 [Gryllus longicercus]|uniref:Uncharacterized protein n=1 Tax=Gryllus longicercus TaxID=2509291 RepID=A0AAN9Z8V9_9ORTH
MSRALWLLSLLLLTAALLQTATADEEPAAEERGEADANDDSDDGDDDDDDDQNCGAGIEDGDGNGPSLDAHGITELAEAARDPRSLVLGWRQYGDCEVFKKTVRRLKGFGRLHDVDVVVPRGNATITHVVARPADDATGALRAERRGGGVGQTWVHLKLRAPRGFGLHYEVFVYGR